VTPVQVLSKSYHGFVRRAEAEGAKVQTGGDTALPERHATNRRL
jgi:hypothetical protein